VARKEMNESIGFNERIDQRGYLPNRLA